VINDTVVNFYKQPIKYNKSDLLSDGPSDSIMPKSNKTNKSVGFSGQSDKMGKGGKDTPKEEKVEPSQVIVDLENQ
jgi:hypothetical protein